VGGRVLPRVTMYYQAEAVRVLMAVQPGQLRWQAVGGMQRVLSMKQVAGEGAR
jgi:hypothetical protein